MTNDRTQVSSVSGTAYRYIDTAYAKPDDAIYSTEVLGNGHVTDTNNDRSGTPRTLDPNALPDPTTTNVTLPCPTN